MNEWLSLSFDIPTEDASLVTKGSIRMVLKDREFTIGEGEFCVIPRGVEHQPIADELAHVVLFEPATTLNTGNTQNDFTRPPGQLDHI